ncbi:MAG: hypothetical protein J7K48_01285 [Thermococcus sp.]|uniref:Uncharacterized protein n=1 Tax=Thermococcus guaymasensis DSM 11113 TaxID=1432656 RepID=A0A0X1KII7_9EURY|nr:hypothetical protein [Thermococcus guaymasensis]AJC71079.1 hypothetical protein X802_01925 [Thermococcus guaymasensis DSM 11113]MCD6523622.1 hypothetical protein [Thermococcus sp.]
MRFFPRPKAAIVASFLIIALYFVGIGFLSTGHELQVIGAAFIGGLHLLLAWGIYTGRDWGIASGKYLSFIDLIFSILWMMLGVLPQGATLFFLSALILVLLSDPEVEAEVLGRY